MHVHLLRTTRFATGKKFWVAFSETQKMNGALGESKSKLLKRWEKKHDKPTKLTRYVGICQPSEAACTIASIMNPTH